MGDGIEFNEVLHSVQLVTDVQKEHKTGQRTQVDPS